MLLFLVTIRLLFFLLCIAASFLALKHNGKGFFRSKIKAVKSRLISFQNHMETSVNARKYFIFLVVLALIFIQFIDYTILTDYKYYRDIYMFPTAQFFIGWVLTLMLFPYGKGYKFANNLFSTYNRSPKYFGLLVLFQIILIFSPFVLLSDMAFVILTAMITYPKMRPDTDPKGRKPMPEIVEKGANIKKAA